MQYPVPQFTDVEDKIIGTLTIRQFGIIFGAGTLVFLVFMATKSIAAIIIAAVIIGIPALGVAFARVNGRPMYKMFPFVYKFFTSPKLLIFHKEARNFSGAEKVRNVEIAAPAEKTVVKQTPRQRINKVNELLKKKQEEEERLIKQLKV